MVVHQKLDGLERQASSIKQLELELELAVHQTLNALPAIVYLHKNNTAQKK